MSIKIKTPYPISVNRYYRTFRNITIISKEGKLFKEKVRLTNLRVKPVTNDVALSITIHPKQKKDGSSYNQVIDIDNGLKCILDSLNSIAYIDDKQVRKLSVCYGSALLGGGATIEINNLELEL